MSVDRNKLKLELTATIKNFALDSCKIDLIGIAPAERFAGAPAGSKPEDFLPGCKSVIVMAISVPDGALQAIMRKREDGLSQVHGIYGAYGYVGGPNYTLLFAADKLSRFVEKKSGEIAVPCPAGPTHGAKMISLRHAAVAAGLGVFGWHSIVITPQFGSRNRFAAVLTTAELEADPLIEPGKLCNPEKCGVCANICPGGCIPKHSEGRSVTVDIGGNNYTYCKFEFDPCTAAGSGKFAKPEMEYGSEFTGTKPENAYAGDTMPNNSFFIHFNSWRCGYCMAYCPVGGWPKHFRETGLSRANPADYMKAAGADVSADAGAAEQ
jgi:epoxyqueuosine reductase QueG